MCDFTETVWRDQAAVKLEQIEQKFARRDTPYLVYATIAGLSLWPLVEIAMQEPPTQLPVSLVLTLGSVAGGTGANLIAEQLQRWLNRTEMVREEEVIAWIQDKAAAEGDLLFALDTIIEKLDTISTVQTNLSPDDQKWFAETLQQELIELGNSSQYMAVLQGDGAIAQGKGAMAVGKGGVLVKGPVDGPVVTGTWNGDYIVGDPGADPERLRVAYLHHMLHKCSQLSLSGINRSAVSEVESSLNLGAIYTALLTHREEGRDLETTIEAATRSSVFPESEPFSALAAFDEHRHLVLLGDPGSGKSTFINFLALCMAGELVGREDVNLSLLMAPLAVDDEDKQDEQNPQPWRHGPLLPVRIILRDLAARGLPPIEKKATASHLWNFIAAELDAHTLGKYASHLHRELQEKGGVILLDGLDEVPEAKERRVQIKEMVTSFAAAFPLCRLLVTSRVYAYQKQDWRLLGFEEALLAPFSRGQIRTFIDRWYIHLSSVRGINIADAQGQAKILKRAIFARDRLQGLAERPLLLTLMVSLHAWRGGSLPEKREQLYADTVALLLDWWEKPKILRDEDGNVTIAQPSLAEWLNVDRERVRELLNCLAYEIHAQQANMQGTADIAQADLVRELLEISKNPDVKPLRLIEYLSQRAGLLVPFGIGLYTFPHRTIQEYLAACYLTDEDFPDKLAELARSDPNRWREVTLLAGAKAARGSATNIWSLVEALCYKELSEAKDDIADFWGAQLAGQALVETADLKRVSPRNKVKLDRTCRWLIHILRQDLLPPLERALAGVNLAQLGDTRPEVMTLEGMQFCFVPEGSFWMGNGEVPQTENSWLQEQFNSEKPLHQLNLPYAYFIGRYPVTNAQFENFVADGGYNIYRYWPEAKTAGVWTESGVKGWNDNKPRQKPFDYGLPYSLPNHPVVGVTWFEMLAFTRWLTETWLANGKLSNQWCVMPPSEAEWEKAARGGLLIPEKPVVMTATEWTVLSVPTCQQVENQDPQRLFPWGRNFQIEWANGSGTEIGRLSSPGIFPLGMSPYGCEDMSGNVWEWTRSKRQNYPYRLDDGREAVEKTESLTLLALRGGSYYEDADTLRCTHRLANYPYILSGLLGFRICVHPKFSAEKQ